MVDAACYVPIKKHHAFTKDLMLVSIFLLTFAILFNGHLFYEHKISSEPNFSYLPGLFHILAIY
jgi:hypothetical protein